MLKNNKINIYGCLLKLIYTPVFATKNPTSCWVFLCLNFKVFPMFYKILDVRSLFGELKKC